MGALEFRIAPDLHYDMLDRFIGREPSFFFIFRLGCYRREIRIIRLVGCSN